MTIVHVVAKAIYRASIKPAEDLAPLGTWDELTEAGRDYWRHLAQAAIDAILSEVTHDDAIEPPELAGWREHWAGSSERSSQDDGRTEVGFLGAAIVAAAIATAAIELALGRERRSAAPEARRARGSPSVGRRR